VCIRYRGNVCTEPLPSNDRGISSEPSRYLEKIDTQTDGRDFLIRPLRWAQVPRYVYVPSFIKIGSGIQKLIGGDTQTATSSHKPTLFFQNKESGLKMSSCPCA
jgi:hypothetical protein